VAVVAEEAEAGAEEAKLLQRCLAPLTKVSRRIQSG
jgi:hypothetical protein